MAVPMSSMTTDRCAAHRFLLCLAALCCLDMRLHHQPSEAPTDTLPCEVLFRARDRHIWRRQKHLMRCSISMQDTYFTADVSTRASSPRPAIDRVPSAVLGRPLSARSKSSIKQTRSARGVAPFRTVLLRRRPSGIIACEFNLFRRRAAASPLCHDCTPNLFASQSASRRACTYTLLASCCLRASSSLRAPVDLFRFLFSSKP